MPKNQFNFQKKRTLFGFIAMVITITSISLANADTNTCRTARDNECDDGGPGSLYTNCSYGTDLQDCGRRTPIGIGSTGLDTRHNLILQVESVNYSNNTLGVIRTSNQEFYSIRIKDFSPSIQQPCAQTFGRGMVTGQRVRVWAGERWVTGEFIMGFENGQNRVHVGANSYTVGCNYLHFSSN